MATETTPNHAASKAKAQGEPANKTTSSDFPGPDFVQREVRAEDLPPSAKVPNPFSQTNTSGTSCIGTSGPNIIDSADEAIDAGQKGYKDKNQEIVDAANELAEAHRKLDEEAVAKSS